MSVQPTVTAVVTTCSMPERVVRCVESILACERPPGEVVVVENRPLRARTAAVLGDAFPGDPRVRCVEQPVRGLSVARNAGLWEARTEVVAFVDDDVVVDPRWSGAIADAFARAPEAGCVTGLILPVALETDIQLIHEALARYGKGFEREVYRADRPPADAPLFPYAAGRFGSGANTALRLELGRALGGFDVDLGAATPSRGGEDLDLYIRVLKAGYAIAYEPEAVVRHAHDESGRALRRHAFDTGIGLTAMLTKQLVAGGEPLELVRRAGAGVRYAMDPESPKNAGKGPGYPALLNWLERLGMALGPLAYAMSRLRRGGRRAAHVTSGSNT